MKRHNGRIIAILALYNMDCRNLNHTYCDEVLNDILQLEKEEEYPVEIDEAYAKKLVLGVSENQAIIDEIISNSLVKYTIDRLSYVDRAIIRCAVFEMKYLRIAKQIIINEALNITKEYASIDDKQVKFNNRLLDSIGKQLYEQDN